MRVKMRVSVLIILATVCVLFSACEYEATTGVDGVDDPNATDRHNAIKIIPV